MNRTRKFNEKASIGQPKFKENIYKVKAKIDNRKINFPTVEIT